MNPNPALACLHDGSNANGERPYRPEYEVLRDEIARSGSAGSDDAAQEWRKT
jgi:hypothetical protein